MIVTFERPLHRVAEELAARLDVDALRMEEAIAAAIEETDLSKILAVRNISAGPIKRFGILFEPETKRRDFSSRPPVTITEPAPTIIVEVFDAASEKQLTACRWLEVKFLVGEPYKAPPVRPPRVVPPKELEPTK